MLFNQLRSPEAAAAPPRVTFPPIGNRTFIIATPKYPQGAIGGRLQAA
jgi:hypothetical protein